MAKIEINKTELVWPGKYNEDGTLKEVPRVSLPFQVIETVNESRATRESKKVESMSLFDVYDGKEGDTFEAGWRNKLIWGDNLLVMGSLLEKFAGKIDLIYIDPPFATGADFSFTAEIGESGEEIFKDQSAIEERAYRDTWGRGIDSYLGMLFDRLTVMRDLLSSTGSIYIHIGPNINHLVRSVADEVFGFDRQLNEIIWRRAFAHSDSSRCGIIHDAILLYSKFDTWTWNEVRQEPDPEYVETFFDSYDEKVKKRYQRITLTAPGITKNGPSGKPWRGIDPSAIGRHWAKSHSELDRLDQEGRIHWPKKGVPRLKRYEDEYEGMVLQDIWTDLNKIHNQSSEATGYDTQKPEALLNRIIRASSSEGDLVADFFCGSGTTLGVSEKLGRRWIGCDLGRWATHVTRKRMLGIQNCKPFEVLNLGKYERQYWQGITFGESKDKPLTERALYEYLAFILKLYRAQPLPGMAHLHGKKAKALVHIGAVDAPVTIGEISAAVEECVKLKQGELHVLGWEWEMGLHDLMVEVAKKKAVKLLLLQIPREVMEQQAAAKGDVRFFELAFLEADIRQPKKLTMQVILKDFVIPNTELIPEDVRSKVKKWSDYIDYWAVDWDFQSDTFMQGWVAYRTRQERKLPLTSDQHSYDKAGKHRIIVKAIDIFGNDTSQAFDVEVK
ncbi:MAG: site-specific DNA-methyltransferase [Terracidiphilus sp.]|jgi:DNA modification methylase